MRKEIEKECQFLETWGKVFKQAAADNPSRLYLRKLYETCVDAHEALQGKPPPFKADIGAGLKRFQSYIQTLATEGAFNAEFAGRRIKYIGGIADMLSEKNLAADNQIRIF